MNTTDMAMMAIPIPIESCFLKFNPEHTYAHLQYTRLLYNQQRYGDALHESVTLANKDGKVAEIKVNKGDSVLEGTDLVIIE
jgi:acetyl/propionyl-CoA carboxylase alpha subunit